MAIENGVQNAELGYILDPAFQIENINGKPAVGGHIEIFEAGTDNKYISYQNFDGAQNPFKIPLGSDGRAVILGDPSLSYDVYAYDSYNNLMFSRLNVQCNVPGTINLSGADTRINNTDGTLDISLQTLGNNVRQYTINTHNKVLDVQSPLYFVENSETATVIGFSGDDYATTADLADKMDISKLEYNEDGEISAYDGSAFAGQGGAGDPEVNELVHSNSATWNDVSAKLDTTAFSTVSGNFLTAIPDNYATKDYVQSSVSSKLDSTAFSTVSGSFLTAHQSLDGLMSASLLGMSGSTITSYNNMPFPLGGGEGDAEVNQIVHANSADWNNVSAKLDTTAFSTVSSNFLTAHQSLDGYLTKTSADTLYQPKGDYADATALDGKVDTSSFTAFSSTTNEKIEYISGALSGSYELSAGSGIDITDYPNEQKTVISVTAQGGNPEVENLVIANSATWDSVTGKADATALNDYATTSQLANKLDTTAFSTVSGDFLTAHQDISNLMPKSESANFYPMTGNPSGFLTAHQDLSDYATTAQVADKLDTTAFSTVSGSFLTAVDLTPYQTKADMTAYQPVGDYASVTDLENYQPVSSMTAYQSAGDYYSASNPSGFITGVDLTPYQTTAGMTAYQPVGDYYSASNPSGFLTAVPESAVSGFIPYSATGVSLPNSNFEIDASGQAYKIFATHSTATYTISNNEVTAENLNLLENDVLQFTNLSNMVQELSADINGDVFSLTPVMTESNTRSAELVYPYNIEDVGVITLVGKFNGITIKVNGTMTHISDRDEKLEYALKSDIPSTADFYPASNPSGFITGVPTGTMNESAFEYDANDKISGYNGSAFAGGSNVPSGTMNESGLEYDASGNISAYSGSAFAAQLPEEEEVEFEEINISGISAATDYVTATSGDINSTIDNVSANSGAWGGSALLISAGQGIDLTVSDNTLVVGAVPSAFYTLSISNIVLTASLPGTPDSNTLYLIQE